LTIYSSACNSEDTQLLYLCATNSVSSTPLQSRLSAIRSTANFQRSSRMLDLSQEMLPSILKQAVLSWPQRLVVQVNSNFTCVCDAVALFRIYLSFSDWVSFLQKGQVLSNLVLQNSCSRNYI